MSILVHHQVMINNAMTADEKSDQAHVKHYTKIKKYCQDAIAGSKDPLK